MLSEGPAPPAYKEPVTAVAFATSCPLGGEVATEGAAGGSGARMLLLAVGRESGAVEVWGASLSAVHSQGSKSKGVWQRLCEVKRAGPSSGAVRQLAWRPGRRDVPGLAGAWESELAVASDDCTLRVFDVAYGQRGLASS